MELLKYIPIATVACYEAFFRSTVKEIVDFGKPYSNHVANYNQSKNVKLDFEVISAIQTKTLTVGDFVSHILPYNNLSDVVSNISVLIDRDFMEELKTFTSPGLLDDDHKEREHFRSAGVLLQVLNAPTGSDISSATSSPRSTMSMHKPLKQIIPIAGFS